MDLADKSFNQALDRLKSSSFSYSCPHFKLFQGARLLEGEFSHGVSEIDGEPPVYDNLHKPA